jgi:hypothetical protein
MPSTARTQGYWVESHLGRGCFLFLYVFYCEDRGLSPARRVLQNRPEGLIRKAAAEEEEELGSLRVHYGAMFRSE